MTKPASNESSSAAAPAETCSVLMLDEKPCGRRSLGEVVNGIPSCLMHTPLDKDDAAFQAEFERILDEAGTGVADFTRFVFPNANYARRKFKAHCVFSGATFTQDAYFAEATFTQNAYFSRATFTQKANFSRATFTRNANFSSATFTQNAHFRGATFAQEAHFLETTFTQNAYFGEATFAQKANFILATFTQNADFSRAAFTQNAGFSGAAFTQDAYFGGAAFMRVAYFTGAKFLGAAEFRETKFQQDEELFAGPVFSLTEFVRPEAIVFYKTYLGQALFHNCDVSKLNFSSVEWRQRKRRGKRTGKRMVFEEEVILDDETAVALKPKEGNPDERDYGLIAELYQQLKKNYDDRKDYWAAGDFHYGEMEMRRLHSRWPNFGLVAWYKHASQYGESYVRPAAVLLIVLAIFTLLFPLAGLELNENPPHSAALATQQTPPSARTFELSYKRFADFVAAYPGRKWVAPAAFFGHSLMTALSVAGFQKELKYEPSYPWGRALALLELLLTSTLIALFLLAVRRQFKR